MPIRKQEFYEGAALHLLARTGGLTSLRYEPPIFIVNGDLRVMLKYSTKGRSPWGFTFMPEEQSLLEQQAALSKVILGLVCGSDGVAAFDYEAYLTIAPRRGTAIYVSCFREHGEHYEINGPEGRLSKKVAPSNWQRILER